MASKAVSIRGADNVIKAYKALDIPAWSFWYEKQLQHAYDGDDLKAGANALQSWLNMIGTSSNAIYTLKFYKNLGDDEITEATPAHRSFNIKLNMEDQTIVQYQNGSLGRYDNIDQRLQKIEALLTEEEEDDDDPPEEDTMGKIKTMLDHPVIAGILGKWLGGGAARTATVSGIPEEQQLEAAIKILKEKDPFLSRHLYKLAQIATHNNAQFQLLLSTLDNMA